jgi:NAD(P) transhydrogenase
MTNTYDLVVIGAGPAGQSAAELAAFLGRSVLIVERGRPGGTVTTTGGVPTKTLREVALSLAAGTLNRGGDAAAATTFADALPAVRAATIEVCESLQGVVARQIAARGIAYVRGQARLTRDGVAVDLPDGSRRDIVARAVVLAVGSKPARPAGFPFDDPDIYDPDEIFSLRRTPADVVIAGAGPVGIEFATIFTVLGVPVTLIDRGERLLPAMDSELTALMRAELEGRGVRLLLGRGVDSVSRRNGRLAVTLAGGAAIDTDAVLVAAGRTANTNGLGLEAAGIALDPRGRIVVDRYYQTSCAGIYAVGDAVAPTLASVAAQQGRCAVCHALGLAFGVPIDRAASAAVYGMPEIAGVGATEDHIKAGGAPYVVGRCDLSQTARGSIARRGGRLKLVVSADDRKLLGVHCIGDIASELVGMGHAVLHMGGAVDVFLTLALNTPTYCAAYRDAAIDAMGQLAALARRPALAVQQPSPALQTPL